MQWVQFQWSTIWTVTTAASQTNERAAGITGDNPFQLDQYMAHLLFAVRVTANTGFTLNSVAVYGAGNANGFPPVNTHGEALFTTQTNIGINQGVLRQPRGRALDPGAGAGEGTDAIAALRLLPQFLLLEYTATVGAGSITFVVEACFMGPNPIGNI